MARDLSETRNARWNRSLPSRSEVSLVPSLDPTSCVRHLSRRHDSLPVPRFCYLLSRLFLISNEQMADRPHHVLFFIIIRRFSFTERRPPTVYPANPFEEQQRLQRPPSRPQRQQVHHQPQPQQPARFSQLLSGPGYQGGIGPSSSSQSASSSRSQTISSFAGELYSEGQPEIKPLYQGSSMTEHPAIETHGPAPGRKRAPRTHAVKRGPGTPGPGTSARRRTTAKVTVACNFCRGEHSGPCSTFVFENLTEPPIGTSAHAGYCDIDLFLFSCCVGR